MPAAPSLMTPRPRRWRRWLLGAALVVGVIGTSAWLAREWWLGPLAARAIEQALHEQLGGRWQVEQVRGSFVGSVRVVGLACVEAAPTNVVRRVRIAETTVDYHILKFFGAEPLLALDAVALTGVELDVDTTLAAAPDPSATPTTLAKKTSVFPVLPWAAQVSVTGQVQLITKAGVVRLDAAQIAGRLEALRLQGDARLADQSLGTLQTELDHVGNALASGWTLRNQLGQGIRLDATGDELTDLAPRVQVTAQLGAGNTLSATSSAQGWQIATTLDAALLPTAVRVAAQVVGLELPAQGRVQARGTVDTAGLVQVESADAAMPGWSLSGREMRWQASHGLIAARALNAKLWPSEWLLIRAANNQDLAVFELQASAVAGQLTFSGTSRGGPGTVAITGTADGSLASAAWADATLQTQVDITADAFNAAGMQSERSNATLNLAGTWKHVAGKLEVQGTQIIGGGWQVREIAADATFSVSRKLDHAVFDGTWKARAAASRVGSPAGSALAVVHAGQVHADDTGTTMTADLSAPLATTVTVISAARCTADAAWLTALRTMPVRAQATVTNADLALLASYLPAGVHVDGQVSGSAETPDLLSLSRWSGTLAVTRANLGGLPPLPPLLNIDATLRADQDGLTVTTLRAGAGGGTIAATGTLPLLGQPGPLALTITTREALLLQRPDVRLRANADLLVAGTWLEPALKGRVHITDLVATTPVSWFGGRDLPAQESPLDGFGALPPPWNRTTLDLHLTGGQDTQPALEIRNNVVVATLAVDVTVRGRADVPVPSGEILCRGGRLSLPFSAYRIDGAALRFRAADPYDPTIEATASTQMQGYLLTVQVTGTVRRPHIDVSSSPPLAPDEALVLASTGRLPVQVRKDGAATSAISVALPFVGRELQRWVLGDGFADDGSSLFDQVVVLYDEKRSERGLPTARLEYQIHGPWHLFGERDVYETYNAGLMWRWIFNDPARRTSATTATTASAESLTGPAAAWQVVPAPGVTKLPVSAGALLDTVPARQRHGEDANQPANLASAAQRMVDRLHEAGYPEASVEPNVSTVDALTTVRLVVTPGLPWQVATVRMSGEPLELATAMQGIVATGLPLGEAPTATRVAATRSALRSALNTAGYALAQVRIEVQREYPGALAARCVLTIQPGMRYYVAVATPEITEPLPPELSKRLIERGGALHGKSWTRRQVIELRAQLKQLLRTEGYAFAKVVMTCDEPQLLPMLICQARITPGRATILRAVTLNGFEVTSETYVRKRLDLEPGQLLRDGEPEAAVSRLRRSGVARSVSSTLKPVDRTGDTQSADLAITAEEAPPRSVELSLGVGSYEGARGGALYRDTNLFGWGRTWEVGAERSQRSYGGHTSIIDRDLLGIQRVLSVTLSGGFRREPSFDRTKYSGEVAVRAPLTSWLDLRTAYTLDAERATERVASVDGSEQEGFVLNGVVDSQLIWDGRDDRQLPTNGGMAQCGVAVSDPVLGSQVSYVEWSSRLGWVVPLIDERLVGAAQVAGAVRRITDGAETLPIQYRMFLGGSTTVRSFGIDELSPVNAAGEALGGLTTAYANLELRAKVSGNVHVAGFYDVGKVSEQSWSLDGALGQAIGGGVRYHLPIGPIRVDAAYNPGERWAATKAYAIEAAIGFTF